MNKPRGLGDDLLQETEEFVLISRTCRADFHFVADSVEQSQGEQFIE